MNTQTTTKERTSFNDCKVNRSEFDSLTTLEQRQYFLQKQQFDTNYWLTLSSQIQVVVFAISILAGLFFVINSL